MSEKKLTFNHEGCYVCECGKKFTNSQSFNGHKGHCKVHLGEDKWHEDLARSMANLAKGVNTVLANRAAAKKSKHDKAKLEWAETAHYCECCGAELPHDLDEVYGSGRFCSAKCARSFSTKNNREETSKKVSEALKGRKSSTSSMHQKSPYEVKHCKICGKELSRKNKSGYCQDCIWHAPELAEQRSESSKHASSYVKNHVTWLSRNILSYPEKFFIQVLDNNTIKYDHNYMVSIDSSHRYFLDFYIEVNGVKLDLEIDGKQHKYDEHIEHDLVRDKNLTNLGYVVYRIDWNEINSDQGKDLMKTKINKFLDYYNSLKA